jgi:ectoine hydroxylase-related dioxygenase (phytanoyl-CoA dioxygenase family)
VAAVVSASWTITILPASTWWSSRCSSNSNPRLLLKKRQPQQQQWQQPVAAVSLSVASSSNDVVDVASSLLYKEQEKMLVQRGIYEGQLMSQSHHTTILQANVVKVAKGGSGGFGFGGRSSAASSAGRGKKKGSKSGSKSRGSGGSSSSSSIKAQQQQELLSFQGKAHAQVLQREGVVRIDNIFSNDLANQLRSMVYEMRAESTMAVERGQVPSLARFADVLLKENRCDMTLPLVYSNSDSSVAASNNNSERHALIVAAMTQLMQNSPLGATIQALFGPDAVLYELSCLMSDTGSFRQVVHPDTPCNDENENEAVLYTCFVALQDIDESMGPTVWLPRTHTKEIHTQFQDESPLLPSNVENNDNDKDRSNDDEIQPKTRKDLLLQQKSAVLGTLPQGACGIFDSRLLHCGGANTNTHGTSRALFYCTFRSPRVNHFRVGNPGSIRRDLINKFTLDELNRQLTLYNTGQANVLKPK